MHRVNKQYTKKQRTTNNDAQQHQKKHLYEWAWQTATKQQTTDGKQAQNKQHSKQLVKWNEANYSNGFEVDLMCQSC